MAEQFAKGLASIAAAEHISPEKTGDPIEAKRVAAYFWNPAGINPNTGLPTGTWERSSGSTPALATRLDQTTTNITYVGKAPVGSATSSAVWQIFKMDETTSNTLVITYADGNALFDNIWDSRASLTYS